MKSQKLIQSLFFLSIYFLSALSLQAAEISAAAQKAETLVEEGKPYEGYRELEKAMEAIWVKMPLVVENTTLVTSSSGYGIYAKRQNNKYAKGEKIVIYSEVFGFGYGSDPLGNRVIGFDIDMKLLNADGEVVFAKDDWVSIAIPVRHKNREFTLDLTINPGSTPAGAYTAEVNVRDQNSDKSSQLSVEFEYGL